MDVLSNPSWYLLLVGGLFALIWVLCEWVFFKVSSKDEEDLIGTMVRGIQLIAIVEFSLELWNLWATLGAGFVSMKRIYLEPPSFFQSPVLLVFFFAMQVVFTILVLFVWYADALVRLLVLIGLIMFTIANVYFGALCELKLQQIEFLNTLVDARYYNDIIMELYIKYTQVILQFLLLFMYIRLMILFGVRHTRVFYETQ